uniref:Uncharacterized protein n=1 Tax=Oryza punctata TaxID=4537 RepID=A0A0E0JHB0_ORYPU
MGGDRPTDLLKRKVNNTDDSLKNGGERPKAELYMCMGRGKKKSVLASLFGFKSGGERPQQEEEATAAAAGTKQLQQQRSYYCQEQRRVWPSDDDNDNYYAERDIDRRASEFIDRSLACPPARRRHVVREEWAGAHGEGRTDHAANQPSP